MEKGSNAKNAKESPHSSWRMRAAKIAAVVGVGSVAAAGLSGIGEIEISGHQITPFSAEETVSLEFGGAVIGLGGIWLIGREELEQRQRGSQQAAPENQAEL